MKNGQNDKVLELAQKFKEEALVPMKVSIFCTSVDYKLFSFIKYEEMYS